MSFRATTIFAAFLVAAGLVTSWVVAQDSPSQTPSPEAEAAKEKSAEGEKKDKSGMIRHVVLFEFKEDAPAEKVAEIEKAFAALPEKIEEIADLEWGKNNSPEGLNKGFTHCFLISFDSEADRAAYLPHPDHKAFANLLRPHLKDVLVVDYTLGGDKKKEGEKEKE
ncbi:Dabb family protein [Aeoliella sp.]|uniref:Dabb family protein n=1 Tax=Aeoliella sp. TaxID=2795800 RepID=UPI003CCC3A6D